VGLVLMRAVTLTRFGVTALPLSLPESCERPCGAHGGAVVTVSGRGGRRAAVDGLGAGLSDVFWVLAGGGMLGFGGAGWMVRCGTSASSRCLVVTHVLLPVIGVAAGGGCGGVIGRRWRRRRL